MRMYTIQELTKKKIAILLPTEEEYKIFEYYVESNEIRSCILCYDGWNEYKNYTCMAYSALGFMLYSKKEKKKFSIKKFIRLEQLIMEDTLEKQERKLEKGFASVDEFLYYLISNNIIEKRNIVSTPSTSGGSLIEFMVSSDKFKFFQRLNRHKTKIGDLFVKGFHFKHPDNWDGVELFLVAIELRGVQILEDETVIITVDASRKSFISNIEKRIEDGFKDMSEFVDFLVYYQVSEKDDIVYDYISSFHNRTLNFKLMEGNSFAFNNIVDKIRKLKPKIGEWVIDKVVAEEMDTETAHSLNLEYCQIRSCGKFLNIQISLTINKKTKIKRRLEEGFTNFKDFTQYFFDEGLAIPPFIKERVYETTSLKFVIEDKNSFIIKMLEEVNPKIGGLKIRGIDIGMSDTCTDGKINTDVIVHFISYEYSEYLKKMNNHYREKLLNKTNKEESKIKIFDKFAEIEDEAVNLDDIHRFYKKRKKMIYILCKDCNRIHSVIYKTKKTRDSDYKKLLEVENNGKRKV